MFRGSGGAYWPHMDRKDCVRHLILKDRIVQRGFAAGVGSSLLPQLRQLVLDCQATPLPSEHVLTAYPMCAMDYAIVRQGTEITLLSRAAQRKNITETTLWLSPKCLRGAYARARLERIDPMPKISKRLVESAITKPRDYVIWDDDLPGFGLRVFASGKRSYVIQYRNNGSSRRFTIGLHGIWTPETARREAKAQLGRVAQWSGRRYIAGRARHIVRPWYAPNPRAFPKCTRHHLTTDKTMRSGTGLARWSKPSPKECANHFAAAG